MNFFTIFENRYVQCFLLGVYVFPFAVILFVFLFPVFVDWWHPEYKAQEWWDRATNDEVEKIAAMSGKQFSSIDTTEFGDLSPEVQRLVICQSKKIKII